MEIYTKYWSNNNKNLNKIVRKYTHARDVFFFIIITLPTVFIASLKLSKNALTYRAFLLYYALRHTTYTQLT